MNRIQFYEKWMKFKSHFKQNQLLFSVIRNVKYKIIRKIEIRIRITVWTIEYKLKQHKIIPANKNDEKLLKLKNSYKGETAFIIGNGPSLKSEHLDLLNELGVYSFASNRITCIFNKTSWRPNCYLALDRTLCSNDDQTLNRIINENIELYAFGKALYKRIPRNLLTDQMLYCNILPTDFFSKKEKFGVDPTLYFGNGFTVTYFAIQLAVYMGFRKICLLGVDCNYANVQLQNGKVTTDYSVITYFDSDYDKNNHNSAYIQGMIAAYVAARDYAQTHEIEIINVSELSKLDIFKKVDMKEEFLQS